VVRAQGEQAADDLASGELITKNPRFSYDQVSGAINQVFRELRGNGVYQLTTGTIAYTTDKWYDADYEEIIAAWYVDTGASPDERRVPFWKFEHVTGGTSQVFLAAAGFTGNITVLYRDEYAALTDLPDRVGDIVVAGAIYQVMGGTVVTSTTDPGRRTDRTVQGGQEGRDSIWFLREFIRLRDLEIARLALEEKRVQRDFKTQRARRFIF
jgi:hypothetical protein